jgi:hypothetical protein
MPKDSKAIQALPPFSEGSTIFYNNVHYVITNIAQSMNEEGKVLYFDCYLTRLTKEHEEEN